MEAVSKRPFSREFVLNKTADYMERTVETSIRKALDKVAEYADDQAKSQEIFQTLAELHSIRKVVQSLRVSKPQATKGVSNV